MQREETWTPFYSETRRLLTLGGMPGFLIDLRFRRVSHGMQLVRRIALPGYRLASPQDQRVLVLKDPEGRRPKLWLLPSGLRSNHRLRFENGNGLVIVSHPRNHGGFRLAFLFADHLTANAGAVLSAIDEVLHPPTVQPRRGRAILVPARRFPWRRCLRSPRCCGKALGRRSCCNGRWETCPWK